MFTVLADFARMGQCRMQATPGASAQSQFIHPWHLAFDVAAKNSCPTRAITVCVCIMASVATLALNSHNTRPVQCMGSEQSSKQARNNKSIVHCYKDCKPP